MPPSGKNIMSLEVQFDILAPLPPGSVMNIDDGAPKAEWKPTNIDVATTINVAVTWGQIAQAIAHFFPMSSTTKLADPPGPPPANGANVLFTWEWKPFVTTIYPNVAGLHGGWRFEAEPGKGLDGTHTMIIALRRSKTITAYSIQLTEAKFTVDYGWLGGHGDFTGSYLAIIPVNTQ
jgi:hypothetical protein